MKELKLEQLTTRQKLGMTMTGFVAAAGDNVDYILELIKNHSLGAVWIQPPTTNMDEIIAKIKETADYPILIICDAESGIGDYKIGKHNAIGCTGSEKLAYTFGKVTAITARKMGFNVLCNPLLDMANGNCCCGGNARSLGNDKYKVTELAKAEAKAMHDCGILTVAKHYPGSGKNDSRDIDSHMGEVFSKATEADLLDYSIYPYLELMKENLLDGIMIRHGCFPEIDPDFPASLSKKVIDIIRKKGFDGFAITDALCMMGVVAKFGKKNSIGLAVGNGNDLALPYTEDNEFSYNALCECYDEGMIADDRLDEAVRRVLEAQHKTLAQPKYTALTDEDIANFDRINLDSVFAKTDAGVSTSISRDGKHFFAILTENVIDLEQRLAVDTFSGGWYRPYDIADKLKELFPNSTIETISQFPSPGENWRILEHSSGHEDVIFITFFNSMAYIGTECLTSRILSLMNAMQMSNRISTVVHFGNPYVLEDVPHMPRVIVGTTSAENTLAAIDVLAGNYPANGVLTYDIKLK